MFSVTELALQISQRTLSSVEFHGCFACSFPFREGVTSSLFCSGFDGYCMLRFVISTQHLQIQCFPMTIEDVLMSKSEQSDQLSSV